MKPAISISQLSGKLEHFHGISTNPLTNDFCNKMALKNNTICNRCYSRRMLRTFRMNAVPAFDRNGKKLSESEVQPGEMPRFAPGEWVRLLPHGELINDTMMENFVKIAKHNHWNRFVLWTKRKDIVKNFEIPANMFIIYSNPNLNRYSDNIPEKFHGIFNVFTEEYALHNNIDINCMQKCIECMKCYSGTSGLVINEMLKKQDDKK